MSHLLDRRGFLGRTLSGLSSIALAHLLSQDRLLAASPLRPPIDPAHPYAPRPPHFEPKARRVLVIFCSGALSHVDTFDYKPELIKRHDTPMPGSEGLVTFQGANGNLIKPIAAFKPRGQSGKMVSDLLPHLADLADEMCFIHSMTGKSNTHGPAESQMGTGFTLDGFPSMGAWVTYALGSENQNLPAFVAIPDPRGVPQNGPRHWNSAFLPASFQGTAFSAQRAIPNLARPAGISAESDQATREFLRRLNDRHLERNPGDADLSARISSYELAARMQLEAAALSDLSGESPATRALYGADDTNANKAGFARNCILARRLLEKGVRFVQLFNGSYAMGEGVGNWDGHKRIADRHRIRTHATFQRGANGRDHNPKGFTVWLSGAGVKRAYSHGATDEFGHMAVQDVTTIYDLHATILHLLGLDHERLSFYNNGAERRLTDVHGRVIRPILS